MINYGKSSKGSNTRLPAKKAKTNSTDPDQTTSESEETVWSGSSLFAILTHIVLLPALITGILFESRKTKVFEILVH